MEKKELKEIEERTERAKNKMEKLLGKYVGREKLEKLIRLLYLEGYKDGKKQKETPYKYTADSDKGKELYDYVEQELDKAREEGRREQQKLDCELYGTAVATDKEIEEMWKTKLERMQDKAKEELSKLKQ
jgi:hypothetical protein